jgi:hypothetical protein
MGKGAGPMGKSLKAVEIILLTLFGMAGLCGLMVGLFSLLDPSNGSVNMAPVGFGLMVATLGSIAMIGLRNRTKPASAWLAGAIILWFIGVNLLGGSGFAALSPGNQDMRTNLAYTFTFCLMPGGLLTLLGLGFYGYDHRRGRLNLLTTSVEGGQKEVADVTISVHLKHSDKMERVELYRQQILKAIKQRNSILDEQADLTGAQLEQWVAYLRRLGQRLDAFYQDKLIQRDLCVVPQQMTDLHAQLQAETNPQLRAQLQETLDSYQQQKEQLDSLVTLMRRTELEIDEALAKMGAMYSQMQLLEARDIDQRQAVRLSEDIKEQVNHLGDLLAVMDEIYYSSQDSKEA